MRLTLTSILDPLADGEDPLTIEAAFTLIFVDWIIGTVAVVILGCLIGCFFRRFLSRWIALLVLLFVVLGSVTLLYGDVDFYISIPYGEPQAILAYPLLFYAFIVLMSCSLGQRLRHRFGPAEPGSRRDPIEELVIYVELSAYAPETADIPWTAQRWKPLSLEEKRAWVETNMAAINRYLEEDLVGNVINDEDFIAEMQRIDSSTANPTASSLPHPLRQA